MPDESPPHAGGGALGIITKKVGPLPLYAWVAAGAVGFLIWKKRKGATSSSSSSAAPAPVANGIDVPGNGYSSGGDSAAMDSLFQQWLAQGGLAGVSAGQPSTTPAPAPGGYPGLQPLGFDTPWPSSAPTGAAVTAPAGAPVVGGAPSTPAPVNFGGYRTSPPSITPPAVLAPGATIAPQRGPIR